MTVASWDAKEANGTWRNSRDAKLGVSGKGLDNTTERWVQSGFFMLFNG